MTLKSNKNEPADILETVNSVRTALSDLYLEQLLHNKPKSDKVRGFSFICFVFFYHVFSEPPHLGVCFREADAVHMIVVGTSTRSLKIEHIFHHMAHSCRMC